MVEGDIAVTHVLFEEGGILIRHALLLGGPPLR